MRWLARAWGLVQVLLPHNAMSRVARLLAESRRLWLKNALIHLWIRHYQVDMSESVLGEAADYQTFGAFFTRALHRHRRLQPAEESTLSSPIDGTLSGFGQLQQGQMIQAKGRSYALTDLLGNEEQAAAFDNCQYASLYLSPRDYHRIHAPLSGSVLSSRRLPGRLFSVNPLSQQGVPQLYIRNRRCACIFETPHGKMAMVLVGALEVGQIKLAWERLERPGFCDWQGRIKVNRGAEVGRFELGSAVILIAPPAYRWHSEICAGMPLQMGMPLASPKP